MKYQFIPAGSSVKVNENHLYLDVGNNLSKGIIDHHHLHGTQKSATSLVYENENLIDKSTQTIVLHQNPDLDCVASSYLATYFLQHNSFPLFSKELCEFLDKADFGLSLEHTINLASLFSVLKTNIKSDEDIVKIGHELIEDMSTVGFDSGVILDKYSKEVLQLNDENNIFQNDLKNSEVKEFILQDRYTNKYRPLKALILRTPQSKLFKSLARELGYDLLIVVWNKKRTVISLKGDSYFTLESIGDKLNTLEKQKREKLNITIKEPNREGYNIPDPWYDGRVHNYTIIDTPRFGTLLDFNKILSAFKI